MINKHYKYLDLARVLFCIAILLYHLGLLQGGYLAVCSFFVLSGYFTCRTSLSKDKFSLKKYYINRFFKIYLPLVAVVFISIFAINFFENINWFNLKPETTSVLLGYNNYWQLNANLDYFARHIDSPFMHFWYIAILLQFDILFPIIYLPLKKLGDKFQKIIPCLFTFILAVISMSFFYYYSKDTMMVAYYNSLLRAFSLLFGVLMGFNGYYYKDLVINFMKKSIWSKIVFYIYLVALCIMFYSVPSSSKYFNICMLLTTLITCRLISYSLLIDDSKERLIDKIIKWFSKISYLVYLVQYPVIFIFQYITLNKYLSLGSIILLTLIISIILNTAFSPKSKKNIFSYPIKILVLTISLIGFWQYVMAKNYNEDMKKLEEDLANNAKASLEKQKSYEENLKKEKALYEEALAQIENSESGLDNFISNMSIVGVGDSVMLGATKELYEKFPKGYFDAKISRTAWKVNGILTDLKTRGLLGDVIIINVGANGDCPNWCKKEIMNTISDKKVFWLNATNDRDVNVNEKLNLLAKEYNNLHIIDWNNISKGHPEYFVADGIHLTEVGRRVYTDTIYESIKKVYLDEINTKKAEFLNNYQLEQNKKLTIYGNDLLVNVSSYLTNNNIAELITFDELTYEELKNNISNAIKNKTLNHKIVFAFDNNFNITNKQFVELIGMCKEHEIYIIKMDDRDNIFKEYPNVKIIDFYDNISKNNDYLMVDKIHLTDKGNKKLSEILNSMLK